MKIFTTLFTLLLFSRALFAEVVELEQPIHRIHFFKAPNSDDGNQPLQNRLVSSNGNLPRNSYEFAEIRFKSVNRQLVGSYVEFFPAAPSEYKYPVEWQSKRSVMGNGREKEQSDSKYFDLKPKEVGLPINLYAFNEFWLDYQVLPESTCTASVLFEGTQRIFGAPNTSRIWTAQSEGYPDTVLLDKIDLQTVNWVLDDHIQIIKRFLGISSENVWSYKNIGGQTTVFGNIFADLSGAKYIDVEVDGNVLIDDVTVSIKKSSSSKKDVELFFSEKDIEVLNGIDGKSVARLYFERAINGGFFETVRAGMVEQAISIKVKSQKNLNIPPQSLKKIYIYGRPRQLSFHQDLVNSSTKRLIVDLRSAGNLDEVALNRLEVRALSLRKDEICAFKLISATIVDAYAGEVPAYSKNIEGWTQKWGGPFKKIIPAQGAIEQPGIISYHPIFDRYPQAIVNSEFSRSDESFAQYYWPLNIELKKDTKLFLGGKDSHKNYPYVRIILQKTNGGERVYWVKPNESILLGNQGDKLVSVRLDVPKAMEPISSSLSELAFFDPSIVDYMQALNLHMPVLVTESTIPTLLAPAKAGKMQVKLGGVTGYFGSNQKISILSEIPGHIKSLEKINFNYRVDGLGFSGNNCTLTIRLIYDNGSIRRELCSAVNVGDKSLDINGGIAKEAIKRGLGAPKRVEWVLHSINNVHSAPTLFDFNFSFSGVVYRSTLEDLMVTPLFAIGRNKTPVYTNNEAISSALKNDASIARLTLPINKDISNKILENTKNIFQLENNLFTLSAVDIFDVGHGSAALGHANSNNFFVGLNVFLKVFLLSCLLLTLFLLYRKRSWLMRLRKSAILLKRYYKHSICRLKTLRRLFLAMANVLILFYALGPIMKQAIKFSGGPGGWALFILACELVFGSAIYLYELNKREILNRRLCDKFFFLAALFVSLLIIAKLGPVNQIFPWVLIPWPGIIYLFLPVLKNFINSFPGAYLGRVKALFWLVIVIALFWMGFHHDHIQRENYFYTFGCLAVVFCFKLSMLGWKKELLHLNPAFFKRVFDSGGAMYFFGAALSLIVVLYGKAMNLGGLAEQGASVCFYFLTIGVILGLLSAYSGSRKKESRSNHE